MTQFAWDLTRLGRGGGAEGRTEGGGTEDGKEEGKLICSCTCSQNQYLKRNKKRILRPVLSHQYFIQYIQLRTTPPGPATPRSLNSLGRGDKRQETGKFVTLATIYDCTNLLRDSELRIRSCNLHGRLQIVTAICRFERDGRRSMVDGRW